MKLLYVFAAPAGTFAESVLALDPDCVLPSEPEGIPAGFDAAISGVLGRERIGAARE